MVLFPLLKWMLFTAFAVFPEGEQRNVARVYKLAQEDIAGFEAYARQVKKYLLTALKFVNVLDALFILPMRMAHSIMQKKYSLGAWQKILLLVRQTFRVFMPDIILMFLIHLPFLVLTQTLLLMPRDQRG